MTPAAHWSEADYYRASRAARRAWEATQPQLTLGLEGADAGTTSLVASAPSSPPNPAAAVGAARTSGTHSSGERGGGLDNHTTRET